MSSPTGIPNAALDSAPAPADAPTVTLAELFLTEVENHGARLAYRYFPDEGGDLEGVTFDEVYELVRAASAGLRELGLTRGDRVAILSENRLEWAIADHACMCSGILDVPIYSTLTVSQVAHILENSQVRLVFVSSPSQAGKALEACRQIAGDLRVVMFDSTDPPDEAVLVWRDFMEHGRNAAADGDQRFRATALEAGPEDVATILYTSGTTGNPKGVMLTHNNLSSNVRAVQRALPPVSDDTSLVLLPLSHVLQRMVSFLHFYDGVTRAFAHSMATVAGDLKIVRPNIAVSVPRLYEKVFNTVMEAQGVKKRLVRWARRAGRGLGRREVGGEEAEWCPQVQVRHRRRIGVPESPIGAGWPGSILRKWRGSPLCGDQPVFFHRGSRSSRATDSPRPARSRTSIRWSASGSARSGGRSPAPKSESETMARF